MIADVSAVANPSTGASVYDSVPYSGQTGWYKVGGTSLSSPIIASVYALSGDYSNFSPSFPYLRKSYGVNLNDIVKGSNGRCKKFPSYFCNAAGGYDGPTGLGTPLGIGAF